MNDEKLLAESWDYEFKYWCKIFKSPPIHLVSTHDRSRSYEMDRAHVFELQNGVYALVVEEGCSCYGPADALIELYPNIEKAQKAFDRWYHNEWEYDGTLSKPPREEKTSPGISFVTSSAVTHIKHLGDRER